jgi:hypothetical protein
LLYSRVLCGIWLDIADLSRQAEDLFLSAKDHDADGPALVLGYWFELGYYCFLAAWG